MEWTIGRLAQLVTKVAQNQIAMHQESVNTIEHARKLGAKSFDGTRDPTDAKSWMIRTGHVFEVIEYLDSQKLWFATFLLEGKAYH